MADTYTGPLTVDAPAGGIGTVHGDGSMRMIMEQHGDQVTISESFTIEGDTETIATALGTIDETGAWTPVG